MDIKLSVFLASILAGSIAVGRLIGAYFLKKFKWNRYLFVSVSLAAIYLIIMLFLLKPALIYAKTHHIVHWGELPPLHSFSRS